ncbi:hypothetical protein, partial [Pseudomonas sp. FeS53a]|uniref:hypothetical protein n=1 Tax=Pseudomonas sp. FeS53a TaxID=1604022 RepID=UPI001F1EA113
FKERFDQVFRLNRGRAFYSSLSFCQAVFRRIFSFYSTTCASVETLFNISGRRIIQHSSSLSTPLFSNQPGWQINHRESATTPEPHPTSDT